MSLIVEKLAATELSSHIGTIDKTRNHAPNHPFSAYIYSLVQLQCFLLYYMLDQFLQN